VEEKVPEKVRRFVLERFPPMKRATTLLAAFGLLSVPTLLVAQDAQSPIPPSSSDIFGPELIAWSEQQRPQPVPQPLPDPPQAQDENQNQSPNSPEHRVESRSFTGVIVKDHDNYVLKVANNQIYQLDDQQKAKRFEDRNVRVVGTLDEKNSLLQIRSIDPIS
jgi:hypothetical protein